jgi:hypothetical protein
MIMDHFERRMTVLTMARSNVPKSKARRRSEEEEEDVVY